MNLYDIRKGIVKFYNTTKGYGFIIEDGTEEEFFLHASSYEGDDYVPQEGSHVEFNLRMSGKGPMADNVVEVKTE